MAIKPELLEILACPKCKGDIQLNSSQDRLVCESCRLLYEIRDDIPIMLIEEAKPLDTTPMGPAVVPPLIAELERRARE